jgi:hypothetical protein
MPDAFKNAGLLVGSIGVPLMAVICVHCELFQFPCFYHVRNFNIIFTTISFSFSLLPSFVYRHAHTGKIHSMKMF